MEYILEKSIETQFRAFQRGFERVVSGPVLRMFRPNELELLVCGSRDLDFDALAKAAQYQDGYEKNSKIVQLCSNFLYKVSFFFYFRFTRKLQHVNRVHGCVHSSIRLVVCTDGFGKFFLNFRKRKRNDFSSL